jgi:hypothetical protein
LSWEGGNPPRLRKAEFERTIFESGLRFSGAIFESDVSFRGARFEGYVNFHAVRFEGDADFNATIFEGDAAFTAAAFCGDGRFISATFRSTVNFDGSTIGGFAVFMGTNFEGDASFHETRFKSDAIFSPDVVFRGHARFGGHYGNEFYDEYGKRLDKGANFEHDANFSGAAFEAWTGFDGVRWQGVANFFSQVSRQTSRSGTWSSKGLCFLFIARALRKPRACGRFPRASESHSIQRRLCKLLS